MTDDPVLRAFHGDVPGSRPRRALAPVEEPVEETWDRKPLVKYVKGSPVEFFTVGALAEAVGRSPITIRYWESNRIIPHPRYRAHPPRGEQVPGKKTMGRRLYTRAQIEVVIAAARECGVLADARTARWKKFTSMIVQGWNAAK